MVKQFLRQAPFGITLISLSTAIFFCAIDASNLDAALNYIQSEVGLLTITTSSISILLIEIFLRKLDKRTIKVQRVYTKKKSIHKHHQPMGVDHPSASIKALIDTLAQNYNFDLFKNVSIKAN